MRELPVDAKAAAEAMAARAAAAPTPGVIQDFAPVEGQNARTGVESGPDDHVALDRLAVERHLARHHEGPPGVIV